MCIRDRDISAIVDGSLLMDYDEAGVEMQFKSAAAISVTYTPVSYTHLDVYKRQALLSPVVVQHGGICNPRGFC